MSETILVANSGRSTGSAHSRRLRAEDNIPAVVYGVGMEPISIAVARRDLRQALSGPAGMNTILDLSVDGTVYPAIVKDMQRHPVRRNVAHVDFIQINLTAEITVHVPVRLIGEAKQVQAENGLVDLAMTEIEVVTTPRLIPDSIEIDISEMTMDSTITIGDVPLPAGVEATHDDDQVVVTVLTMRTPLLDEEDAAAAEAAEAEGCRRRDRRRRRSRRRRSRQRRRRRRRVIAGRHHRPMGLFDRRAGKGTPFDWLVVGLGNPGSKYAGTRHNVGEQCVRLLAQRHDAPLKAGRDNALVGEARFGTGVDTERVVLAFPITYMNDSGRAVSALIRRYGFELPERIIVVHDELDLEPGVLRVKAGGGLAGHNGLRSITQHLKTQDYLRVRIGVGKPLDKDRGASHVLTRVPSAERELLDTTVAEAADAVEMIIASGVDVTMREFHAR